MFNNNIDITESELKNIFKRLDIDRDNRITFNEFKRLFNNCLTNQPRENIINNSNNINKANLSNFINESFYENNNNNNSYLNQSLTKSLKSPKISNSPYGSNMQINSSYKSGNNPNITYEEENFISFLRELIEIENDLEKAKIDLTYKSDFNVEDAFRNFEIDGRGYVTELDLNYGLNEFDVFVPKEEVNLLMKRYDIRNERFLK